MSRWERNYVLPDGVFTVETVENNEVNGKFKRAICKSWNGELGNGMREMKGMVVGMQRIGVEMKGIRVGMGWECGESRWECVE